MATRFIKDTIWTSPNLNQLSDLAERHFYRLLPLPDDHGCCEVTPDVLKGRCYPKKPKITKALIEKWTKELEEADIIRTWEVKGRLYAYFPTWTEHQRIRSLNKRRTPEPPTSVVSCRQLSHVDASSHNSTEKEVGRGKKEEGGVQRGETEKRRIFEFWKKELNHPKAVLDAVRDKVISARLQEGYTIDRILAAVRGIKRSPHHMGQNDRNTKYDDIELICRNGRNVDKFADLDEPNLKASTALCFCGKLSTGNWSGKPLCQTHFGPEHGATGPPGPTPQEKAAMRRELTEGTT